MPGFAATCLRICKTLWRKRCQKHVRVNIPSIGATPSPWKTDKAWTVKWISLTTWWTLGPFDLHCKSGSLSTFSFTCLFLANLGWLAILGNFLLDSFGRFELYGLASVSTRLSRFSPPALEQAWGLHFFLEPWVQPIDRCWHTVQSLY